MFYFTVVPERLVTRTIRPPAIHIVHLHSVSDCSFSAFVFDSVSVQQKEAETKPQKKYSGVFLRKQ